MNVTLPSWGAGTVPRRFKAIVADLYLTKGANNRTVKGGIPMSGMEQAVPRIDRPVPV
jgi:hypothetical protein